MRGSATTVVVGVDGTEHAVAAARWAAAMASKLGGTLRLVHAMPGVDEALLELATPTQEDAGAYPRQLGLAVLERAVEAVRRDHPRLRITRKLSHLSVEKALTESSRRAGMLVLANADVSPPAALALGSTTLAIARHSACPVVVWRGPFDAPNDRPIVVGIDDDDDASRAALATAFGLADLLEAPLRIVHATSGRRAVSDIDIAVLVDWTDLEDGARQRLSSLAAPLSERWPAVRFTQLVGLGRPTNVILDHAASAQMVIVGSRGRGNLSSALSGSTGLGLLHHSVVPVVLCPASSPWGGSTPRRDQGRPQVSTSP